MDIVATAKEKLRHKRILTVPNELTFLRLAFLPFFIIAIKYDRYGVALGVLLLAAASDALDGLLARTLNEKTALGAYLDPLADKLLLSSSYFMLALKAKLPWWLAILVLGRDVLILTGALTILLTVGYRPMPPSIWGKATTLFEILLVLVALVAAVTGSAGLLELRRIGAYIVAVLVMISGLHYAASMARRLESGSGTL